MHKSQNGSALFYILIAVALFAALSFAVSRMMRGSSDIGQQSNAVVVDGLLDYARNMKQAIQGLRISKNCADDEISFERSPFDSSDPDYVNASAPSDFSCHVFHPNGAGIGDVSPSNDLSAYPYFYTGDFAVSDLGNNSSAELSLILRGVSAEQCSIINDKLGVGAPQTDPTANTNFFTVPFQGAYSLSAGVGTALGTGNAIYDGVPSGCFYENNSTSGEYFFYQVLIPR